MIEVFKKYVKLLLPWIIALVACSYCYYSYTHPKTVTKTEVVTEQVIKEVVKQNTETIVSVQEKKNKDDADLVYDTKNSLKVSLNGKEVELKPENKESFTYGKDYVKLNQENSVQVSIDNKPLEPTWSIGVGYSNNSKVAGLVAVRIKKTPFHVWGMTDGKTHMGGIMFSTNYK